jgi:septum site-determining protein MinC
MPVAVHVKGIREGLLISFDEGTWDETFSSLLEHLDSRPDFFRGANAILQLGKHALLAAELAALRSVLADRGVSLRTVLTEFEPTENAAHALGLETRLPAHSTPETPLETELTGSEAVFLRQTLRSGNSIHFPGHVAILGDVNPGAEIVAGGSIIIWGHLRGTVHAGAEGDERAVVCAMDLRPMQLRIAGYAATSPPSDGKWQPEMASLREGKLVAEPWDPKEKSSAGAA